MTSQPNLAPHLLFVDGDLDFAAIDAALESVPKLQLGPLTWLVKLPAGTSPGFVDKLAMRLPKRCAYQIMCAPLGMPWCAFAEGRPATITPFLVG